MCVMTSTTGSRRSPWFETWVGEYPELVGLDRDRNGVACQGIPAYEDMVSVVKRLNRLERAGLR